MALKTSVPNSFSIYDDSFIADGDLTGYKNCVVTFSEQATGKPKVKAPTGQGCDFAGVLLNDDDDCDSGELAQVRILGVVGIEANETINAGDEVTVEGTDGQIEAAASGDWVVGRALEGAAEAGQIISVLLTGPYMKA